MRTYRERSVFFGFLAISLVFHGFLLYKSEFKVSLSDNRLSLISARIEQIPTSSKKKNIFNKDNSNVLTIPIKPDHKEYLKSSKPVIARKSVISSKDEHKQEFAYTTRNSEPSEKTTVSDEETIANIKASLNKKLAEHFHYPVIARRNDWQGQVVITLDITNQGTMKNITVLHSSGYTILDADAVDTLTRIGKLDVEFSPFGYKDISLQLPIIYQLQEG